MGTTLAHNLNNFIQQHGVWGLGIGMFLESIGIPFASAVVALTAGSLISSGQASFLQVLLITTAGLTLSSTVSYFIGYGSSSVGRFLFKQRKKSRGQNRYLEYYRRWGELAILFAQLFGTTRTWASIPAGAMRMQFRKFVIYTAGGGMIYCAAAIGFSYVITSILAALLSWVQQPQLALLLLSLVIIVSSALFFCPRKKRAVDNKQPKTPAQ